MKINDLTQRIIGAAIEVHCEIGPGKLESCYEACLAHELSLRGLTFERQKALPLRYKGILLDCGYRLDLLLVEGTVVVEVKAVEQIARVHEAQLLSYLHLTRCPVGLLLNFNVRILPQGIRRMILDLQKE